MNNYQLTKLLLFIDKNFKILFLITVFILLPNIASNIFLFFFYSIDFNQFYLRWN